MIDGIYSTRSNRTFPSPEFGSVLDTMCMILARIKKSWKLLVGSKPFLTHRLIEQNFDSTLESCLVEQNSGLKLIEVKSVFDELSPKALRL